MLECDGLLARCVQHEVDHLNGVLFIERMEKEGVVTSANHVGKREVLARNIDGMD